MPFGVLYTHLVWATREREPLIDPLWQKRLYGCLVQLANKNRARTVAIGGIGDHVHMLVEHKPSVYLPDLVRHLKGSSSHLINHVLWPGHSFAWQTDYYAASVSAGDVPRVARYIKNQRHRHVSQIEPDLEPESHLAPSR